jgi:hypothetical protein
MGNARGKSDATAVVDYPRTFQEMDDEFRDEAGCRRYLRQLHWPEGFVCRNCGEQIEPWETARGALVCRARGTGCSLTVGTCQRRFKTDTVFHEAAI